MPNKYHNFYYDPLRQGFDSSQWRTMFGAPTVVSNQLSLANASIVHYWDLFRGGAAFNVNVAHAPTAGDNRKFGFYQPNLGACAYFSIVNDVFSANTSDGLGNTYSYTIDWSSAWTGVNTEFKVLWGAGTARFYVNGVQSAVITDISVTGRPMSLYVANGNSDAMTVKYIDVQGVQTLEKNEALEDASFNYNIFSSDALVISESNTRSGQLGNISVNEAVSLAESNSATRI